MRTTLDIDDDILSAARELARAEGKTIGEIISELARQALTSPQAGQPGLGEAGQRSISELGWHVLPDRDGVLVTPEMIERIEEELLREDAQAFDHKTGEPIG